MEIHALEMVPDQTQLRSKAFLIRPKCARWGYGQTQLRSKSPLIRQKCARRGYYQTQLRSKSPLIRQKCARRGYDQTQLRSKSPLIRQKCARRGYDQTQMRSNPPMTFPTFQTKLTSDRTISRPWSRLFRPKLPLIRPYPDHGPDRSALELPKRPCNFGLGTQGCAVDWVWS